MGKKFSPERWERLLGSERRVLLDPDAFLERLDVRSGATVADLGAGPGFFTVPLAQRVGPRGKVYAVDVSPEMVRRLQDRSLPPQVEVKLSGENRLPIPDASVDLALLAFVLHELEDPRAFLDEVSRILKPGGELVVLEWVPQEEELGPPLADRVSADEGAEILTFAGFRVASGRDANASNYYLVAHPATATTVPGGGEE